ncbi:MAG: L-ribulose-5-phosphate 3-epimerase [Erysipelotrichia bacterium]|nr:L-ribulose-5-phosphate 3-epimerase [Erysipelotrichia bacterium]
MDQMRTMARNRQYRLGMYEKFMPDTLSMKEKLAFCRQAGFDWLEISIDESDARLSRLDWNVQEINQLRRDMEETGTKISTMCLSGHRKYPLGSPDASTEIRSLEIMMKAIEFADALGIRIIQLAGYDVYYTAGNEDTRNRFLRNLKKASIMAAQKGVLLGFETMETPFMDTVEKAMKYVSEVDSPYLQIYPDIGNLTNASLIYGKSVLEDLDAGKGHVIAAHLKETVPGKYREIPFGTGHTQFVDDIRKLKSFGVRMYTGEFWYVGQPDWQNTCTEAAAFLRFRLDAAFQEGIDAE